MRSSIDVATQSSPPKSSRRHSKEQKRRKSREGLFYENGRRKRSLSTQTTSPILPQEDSTNHAMIQRRSRSKRRSSSQNPPIDMARTAALKNQPGNGRNRRSSSVSNPAPTTSKRAQTSKPAILSPRRNSKPNTFRRTSNASRTNPRNSKTQSQSRTRRGSRSTSFKNSKEDRKRDSKLLTEQESDALPYNFPHDWVENEFLPNNQTDEGDRRSTDVELELIDKHLAKKLDEEEMADADQIALRKVETEAAPPQQNASNALENDGSQLPSSVPVNAPDPPLSIQHGQKAKSQFMQLKKYHRNKTPSEIVIFEIARKRVARRMYYGNLVNQRYVQFLKWKADRNSRMNSDVKNANDAEKMLTPAHSESSSEAASVFPVMESNRSRSLENQKSNRKKLHKVRGKTTIRKHSPNEKLSENLLEEESSSFPASKKKSSTEKLARRHSTGNMKDTVRDVSSAEADERSAMPNQQAESQSHHHLRHKKHHGHHRNNLDPDFGISTSNTSIHSNYSTSEGERSHSKGHEHHRHNSLHSPSELLLNQLDPINVKKTASIHHDPDQLKRHAGLVQPHRQHQTHYIDNERDSRVDFQQIYNKRRSLRLAKIKSQLQAKKDRLGKNNGEDDSEGGTARSSLLVSPSLASVISDPLIIHQKIAEANTKFANAEKIEKLGNPNEKQAQITQKTKSDPGLHLSK